MTWDDSPGSNARPYTPERIRNQPFSRTRIGQRGVNADEVQDFLNRVAEDVAAGDKEKADLRAEIDRLRHWYADRGEDVDGTNGTRGQARLNIDAVNILSRAQQTADAQIAEAEDYARRLVAQARQQYEEILEEAQRRAEAAASQAVEVYRSSSRVQSTEAEELERRIAYLRTFTEVTQVQLRAVLDGLSDQVDKLGAIPEPVYKQ
jgi:cell division initiation protein